MVDHIARFDWHLVGRILKAKPRSNNARWRGTALAHFKLLLPAETFFPISYKYCAVVVFTSAYMHLASTTRETENAEAKPPLLFSARYTPAYIS